jgi:hypothetical protein
VRELKSQMGYLAQASRLELQNSYVDLILLMVLRQMQRGKDSITEAVEILSDLSLTNEVMKEHVMGLTFDKDLLGSFESLDSTVKAAFTREYNKQNASNTTGVTKKIKGAKAAKTEDNEEEAIHDETLGDSEATD